MTGLATLRGKESDRVAALAEALRAAGVAVREEPAALAIGPADTAAAPGPRAIDSRGDHRIAFAGALLGLARPGLRVSEPGCVAKSWPRFWEDLESLGATAA